jgi:hypothetical protein
MPSTVTIITTGTARCADVVGRSQDNLSARVLVLDRTGHYAPTDDENVWSWPPDTDIPERFNITPTPSRTTVLVVTGWDGTAWPYLKAFNPTP